MKTVLRDNIFIHYTTNQMIHFVLNFSNLSHRVWFDNHIQINSIKTIHHTRRGIKPSLARDRPWNIEPIYQLEPTPGHGVHEARPMLIHPRNIDYSIKLLLDNQQQPTRSTFTYNQNVKFSPRVRPTLVFNGWHPRP